jgi:hypothetical protein
MQRLGAWIEPVLVAEWARLSRGYAERKGVVITPGTAEVALAWVEPDRDVRVARELALGSLNAGGQVQCVWSGQSLRRDTLDIDHCLPWSAWPCGDLWNLMPALRRINQHEKRDKLPSAAALAAARPQIETWWQDAWERRPLLAERFRREASSALAVANSEGLSGILDALEWRRLRLRQDAQVIEWIGPRAAGC